jgi:hypothetical protein
MNVTVICYSCSQPFEIIYSFRQHIFVYLTSCFKQQPRASHGNLRNKNNSRTIVGCRHSSFCIGTVKRSDIRGSIPGKERFFLYFKASRQALDQPSLPSNGCWGRGFKLTSHLLFVLRPKNGGAIPPFPHIC